MEEALTVGPTAPSFDTFQVWDNFNAGNNFENNLPFQSGFCVNKNHISVLEGGVRYISTKYRHIDDIFKLFAKHQSEVNQATQINIPY